MSNNVDYIENHKVKPSEKYFFDANIWIFLFQPLGNSMAVVIKKYSDLLKDLVKNNCSIYISSQILSEFFNAVLRYEFNILNKKNPAKYQNYKRDFKGSIQYNKILNDLVKITQTQILSISKPINDDFDKINISDLLKSIGDLDYNDSYYVDLCTRNNFILVTNDSDFNSSPAPLNIITANNNLK